MASGIYAGAGRQKNLHNCSQPSALSEASVVHLACCTRYCVRGSPWVDLFPVFSPPFTCLASKSQWPMDTALLVIASRRATAKYGGSSSRVASERYLLFGGKDKYRPDAQLAG